MNLPAGTPVIVEWQDAHMDTDLTGRWAELPADRMTPGVTQTIGWWIGARQSAMAIAWDRYPNAGVDDAQARTVQWIPWGDVRHITVLATKQVVYSARRRKR